MKLRLSIDGFLEQIARYTDVVSRYTRIVGVFHQPFGKFSLLFGQLFNMIRVDNQCGRLFGVTHGGSGPTVANCGRLAKQSVFAIENLT
jgi:hypothetical protein